MADPIALVPIERITQAILLIRGHKVMLDRELATLYGVSTKALNQAVKRNLDRFPLDFMFQLSWNEAQQLLRSQTVTLNEDEKDDSRSQPVTLKRGGNVKYRPYAFTEQGVAMLSSVLRSERAVLVNIEIMRAFVQLRQLLSTHADLARKLNQMEQKYDAQFKIVFDTIRELMAPSSKVTRKIGFKGPLEIADGE